MSAAHPFLFAIPPALLASLALGAAGCSLVLPARDTGKVIDGVVCLPDDAPEDSSAEVRAEAHSGVETATISPCRTPTPG